MTAGGWYLLIGQPDGWHVSIYPNEQPNVSTDRLKPVGVTDGMTFGELHVTDPQGKHCFYTDNGVPKEAGVYGGESPPFGSPGWADAHKWAEGVLALPAGTCASHLEGAKREKRRREEEFDEEQRRWDEQKQQRIQQERKKLAEREQEISPWQPVVPVAPQQSGTPGHPPPPQPVVPVAPQQPDSLPPNRPTVSFTLFTKPAVKPRPPVSPYFSQ